MKNRKITNRRTEAPLYEDQRFTEQYRNRYNPMSPSKKRRHKKIIRRRILLTILCICVISMVEYFTFRHLWTKENSNDQTAVTTLNPNLDQTSTEHRDQTAAIVDKDKLNNLINQAEMIDQTVYTSDSVNSLNQTLEAAQNVAGQDSSQNDIDTMYINLMNAIQSLVLLD